MLFGVSHGSIRCALRQTERGINPLPDLDAFDGALPSATQLFECGITVCYLQLPHFICVILKLSKQLLEPSVADPELSSPVSAGKTKSAAKQEAAGKLIRSRALYGFTWFGWRYRNSVRRSRCSIEGIQIAGKRFSAIGRTTRGSSTLIFQDCAKRDCHAPCEVPALGSETIRVERIGQDESMRWRKNDKA